MEELRRSNRNKGKGPVVEENTFEEAIDADIENSEDEFVPVQTGYLHASGSSGTPLKWSRGVIMSR